MKLSYLSKYKLYMTYYFMFLEKDKNKPLLVNRISRSSV